jgi:hypothetical protein
MADIKLDPHRPTDQQLAELLTLDKLETWTLEHQQRGTPIGLRGDESVCYLASYLKDVAGDAPKVDYDSIEFDHEIFETTGWLQQLPKLFDKDNTGPRYEGEEVYAEEGLRIIQQLRERRLTYGTIEYPGDEDDYYDEEHDDYD